MVGSLNLIQSCVDHGCARFILSSTCATYGDHDNIVLTEFSEQRPVYPYGSSKRAVEEMLQQISRSAGLKMLFSVF